MTEMYCTFRQYEYEVVSPLSLFFFNDTPTSEVYTLSLHDALTISEPRLERTRRLVQRRDVAALQGVLVEALRGEPAISIDRKSTRLNSSHMSTSYAVFCLKKKIQRNSLLLSTTD